MTKSEDSINSFTKPDIHDETERSSIYKYQSTAVITDEQDINSELPSNNLQHAVKSFGVRKSEIMNSQYKSTIARIIFFICIFLEGYAYGLDFIIKGNLQVYATSSYNQHSLYATIGVMQSVASAVGQPFFARVSDRFGRLELYLICLLFHVVGTILQSQAHNIQIFAAGAVIYTVGVTGLITISLILMADMSNLNFRLFVNYIPGISLIINTWVSGDIVSAIITNYSWQWGIAMWAFITPLACLPLIYCVGLFCVTVILGFILVPITLAGGVKSKWQEASTIVPLIIGIIFIPIFIIWEAKFISTPLLPFALMKDRGVWSAFLIVIFVNCIYMLPNDFMFTVLVVGMNASIKAATRISQLYSFVTCIVGPILGLIVVKVRRLKAFIIFGCCMYAISLGILFHFRGSNDGIESQKYLNGVIGGLCLMGFGAGFFHFATQVSIVSVTSHEYMSILISIHLACYYVGAAIGNAISGAIWSNKMHELILSNMEDMNISNSTILATYAYGAPFEFILENFWGTPERIAVVRSYAEVQKYLCIAGLVMCGPLIIFPFLSRDHKLESVQSLEMNKDHEKQGIKQNGTAIVNDYDDDPILEFFKKLGRIVFRRILKK
ncbi:uncharacterized protein KGF55_000214 [Candida pseudojiufengensis]|uniref:uncharacterized protein n=1 Tax=Candida pseudojiufengensis TaxID=497109 RepID=UPI002224E2E8|nr:uncharacterized protein KGF55_000214 [Candida pseudojiufengensis]KAI5966805.1 hypothetical protein KGF55_000214 [Candida pseudojiufengensis]